ncbi:hypothetical protein ERICIV_02296 [Paenibacillus larvae subsp. larvae]|uniref:Uncharacterized protein n=1 Tax=Paenibacillus larvae subsp. larvae TaxID=147375 RepID=A0A2L1UE45_9BACL|nr:hypothetical protein [Paenibacillus larvae]AVF26437.1 hypothetical protein ERICIII_02276 [Paenibacillus larvae subsp. larvae]AVF31213.1 hypothetical protein ERICIV_02296 [Paenibacillus larvae subsp. larvae]MCY9745378.1 hypothetical protein [Paenibacillus larvae]MCY9751051.1 hypothetical protein [Paenibacillus larvae]MDR5605330.1 hypothetical protein [Paenibacillus larvae]
MDNCTFSKVFLNQNGPVLQRTGHKATRLFILTGTADLNSLADRATFDETRL